MEFQHRLELASMVVQVRQLSAAVWTQRPRLLSTLPDLNLDIFHQTSLPPMAVDLTDRVSAASVKAGAAGASRASARGAVGVTAKLVGCIR